MIIQRESYSGQRRKLVLAFDVGTTFSGTSYSILDPGVIPEIRPVTRYPDQEHVGGDAKIPSIVYYDRQGHVRAVGAEALQEHIQEEAEQDGWFLSKWFKLHLKPKSNVEDPGVDVIKRIPSLPANKSAEDVLSDFLAYLFRCAKDYIVQTIPDCSFWASIEGNIDFVLTHPNGWEGPQQYSMRCAAIRAGLVPDTREGRNRITFVTEGEACLHFCVHNHLSVSERESVLIVDAGGGTIDLSTYTIHQKLNSGSLAGTTPMRLEEVAEPQCLFAGSVFVTSNARAYIDEMLFGTRFSDSIDRIVEEFDKTAKLRFKSANQSTYIRFGSLRDNDASLQIRNGQMVLPGVVVEQCFEPSLIAVTERIGCLMNASGNRPIKYIFLVGGFGASDWLFSKLQQFARACGITLCRPQSNLNKATADGAVSFYLDRLVSARVARWSYGIECRTAFDWSNPEHLQRQHLIQVGSSGTRYVPKNFFCILKKDTRVSETREFKAPFQRESHDRNSFLSVSVDILSYRGRGSDPGWLDIDPGNYPVLCTVKGDTYQIARSLPPLMGDTGIYYRIDFNVVLLFGLTELKAQLSWMENVSFWSVLY
ncbi:hypothetical protein PM082_015191 [Marasmius tenuissimus]|nr:hypothetical protein PM082_015191 [Marasmius tenuissimus]